MKRPEYVAAAVTACRSALDGKPADTDTLRAVFSRSGFTDGYFTGERREMFGTRQKEDVTAAQGVLGGLRESYQQPRKCAVLDAHFRLIADQPAELTVSDRAGCAVTVTGETPRPARTRPTDLSALEKQFDRLGDTIYTAGKVTAELGAGLMLPASALNAMRRQAAAEMDLARAAAFAPAHPLGEKPEMPKGSFAGTGGRFRVQVRTLAQIRGISAFADRIEMLMLPLQLLDAYRSAGEIIPPERVMPVPPRFVCGEPKIMQMLENAAKLGYRHLACGHVGDLALGKALGFTLHGAVGLHLTNSFAAAQYAAYGLADALRSPALPASAQIAGMLPLGRVIYGRLPLMLVRNCPIRAQVGCGRCTHRLIDRRGAALYTDCTRITDSPDYAELFNAAAVWLCDRPQTWESAAYGLLLFTDESEARTAAVLGAYLDGRPCAPPEPFTRGLKAE